MTHIPLRTTQAQHRRMYNEVLRRNQEQPDEQPRFQVVFTIVFDRKGPGMEVAILDTLDCVVEYATGELWPISQCLVSGDSEGVSRRFSLN